VFYTKYFIKKLLVISYKYFFITKFVNIFYEKNFKTKLTKNINFLSNIYMSIMVIKHAHTLNNLQFNYKFLVTSQSSNIVRHIQFRFSEKFILNMFHQRIILNNIGKYKKSTSFFYTLMIHLGN